MNKLYVSIFVLMTFILSGCSNYILKTHYATATGINDSKEFREVNRTVYWWGIAENRAVLVDTECEISDRPISEVRVKKNVYQTLVGVFTIGIINTSTIEYACGQN